MANQNSVIPELEAEEGGTDEDTTEKPALNSDQHANSAGKIKFEDGKRIHQVSPFSTHKGSVSTNPTPAPQAGPQTLHQSQSTPGIR